MPKPRITVTGLLVLTELNELVEAEGSRMGRAEVVVVSLGRGTGLQETLGPVWQN